VHMVVFTSAEGRPSYYQTETLEDGLKFIERVRNNEGVEDAKLYRMSEIPLQVRTYVKVELASREGEPPEGRAAVDPLHAAAGR
jgi:hypothetical protein